MSGAPDDPDSPDDPSDSATDEEAPRRPTTDEAKREFSKAKKAAEAVAGKYRSIARVNESFYGGDQWSVLGTSKGKVSVNRSAWFDKENVPRIAVNLYTGLLMTWRSLLTKDRPSVTAVAGSDAPEDSFRAAFAQKIIEYLDEEMDTAQKIDDAVGLAGLGGMAGIKVVFLPEQDRIDWHPISVHDFLIDPTCERWDDARWLIFEDHIDEDEAKELLEAGGVEKDPSKDKYQNAANEELEGVERQEFWFRPTRKYPRGFYACFVGSECVELIDYPYAVPDDSGKLQYLLPGAFMLVRKQRGSVYGATNFTDAVSLQRAYNENVSRVQKIIRTTSSVHLKIPKSLASKFNPSEQSILEFPDDKAELAREINYTTPPEIDQAVFAQRDFFAQAMEQVVGLNSTTTGSQTTSLSGRAIENLVQLDENRNADATRSLEKMIQEAFRLSLSLVRLYYSEPRQARITNGDVIDVMAFQGADIEGVDIRLEPASEVDTLEAQKEQIAAERMKNGLAAPYDLQKASNAPSVASSKAYAEQLLQAYMQGQPITELPGDLNLDAVAEVIAKYRARALTQHDQGLWILLSRFEQDIQALQSRANDLQPQQSQQPPGAGTQPQQPGVQPQ